MRIGVDIDNQFIPMTGIQHSVDSLINALFLNQTGKSPHDLYAFASALPAPDFIEKLAEENPGTFEWRNLPQTKFDVPDDSTIPTFVPAKFRRDHPWLSMKIQEHERKLSRNKRYTAHERAEQYDVLHCPEPGDLRFLSYKPKKHVATLYDIATRRFAHAYKPEGRMVWEGYWDYARNKCAHVVAISEATKQDCMEEFEMSSDHITVTPLAARASAKRMEDGPERRALLKKWKLHDGQPFALYAGTLEPRKNLPNLISAFAEVINQDPTLPHKLILAGGNWDRLDIELRLLAVEAGIAGRLITTGYVSNEELNALMSACDVFAYVSRYEGFGMPPLEAMACGAPVVASNTSSLPEVVGEAGIQVDPDAIEDIAAALHTLLTDANENARRRKLSVARAATFTWERTARLTMEAYEKAANS